MATTVANFSAIDDTEVDAESPITETLVTRLRDNSYWIDPATTRTTATSNTLVLTPNQTAGTTQWQEAADVFGLDGTKGTISATLTTSWVTLTTKTSGIMNFNYEQYFAGDGYSSGHINVDLSDDTFVSSYNVDDNVVGVYSGTITTGSDVGECKNVSAAQGSLQFRRDSGNFQYRTDSSNINGFNANYVIL
jgi:hypothetical protein